MEIMLRIIVGVLSCALAVYAIIELMNAHNTNVGVMASLLLLFALCGIYDSLKNNKK